MIEKPTQDGDESVAARLARTLAEKGIVSDTPDHPKPNPHHAASQAYMIWFQQTPAEWREYKETVPQSELHRKYAIACRCALRDRPVPDELIEPMTYAWGYFDALDERSDSPV